MAHNWLDESNQRNHTSPEVLVLGFLLDHTELDSEGAMFIDEAYSSFTALDASFPRISKARFSTILDDAIGKAYGSVLDSGIVQRLQEQRHKKDAVFGYRGPQLCHMRG